MRLTHFEALRPRCPICRRDRAAFEPLDLSVIEKREGEVILEGLLVCPYAGCQREYPILDGIPILLAGLRAFLAESLLAATMRDDLSETLESVLGDCAGPGSMLDATRQHLSSYARDHYGAHDPLEEGADPPPGASARLLAAGLDRASPWPAGPAIDVGCSVGGTTFELAARTGSLVLGVDLNLAMLRLASRALLRGEVSYPRRRTGVVYDRRTFPVPRERAESVDFWACDVADLPFADGAFSLAALLNVVDCVRAPRDLLAESARVLAPAGRAIITSPYDWSPVATPMEAWLGGHSQRSPSRGAAEPVMRALLSPSDHPAAIPGLRAVDEIDAIAWQVRLHDRSTVSYRSHLVIAERQ